MKKELCSWLTVLSLMLLLGLTVPLSAQTKTQPSTNTRASTNVGTQLAMNSPNPWVKSTRPSTGKPAVEASNQEPNGGPGQAAKFGFYVFDIIWTPNFCCSHSETKECQNMKGTFGENHFTIHGLWPNYTDEEERSQHKKHPESYPTFCAPYNVCNQDRPPKGCYPDPETIPAKMATYSPGYLTNNYEFAEHEWAKHGSCTGLDSKTFFQAEIDQLLKLPGDQGTPEIVSRNIGGSVQINELKAAFGNPDSVLLGCDKHCNLQRVGICIAHDGNNMPTSQMKCSKNTTGSEYDNGCVLNQCHTVTIQAFNKCRK